MKLRLALKILKNMRARLGTVQRAVDRVVQACQRRTRRNREVKNNYATGE
jgi:hypothetical protein